MSKGNGILQADLEFGLHIYSINFIFQDPFPAWPMLFHVSNADVSHSVKVNITCNTVGRGSNCVSTPVLVIVVSNVHIDVQDVV
jgi:hypothetical protein